MFGNLSFTQTRKAWASALIGLLGPVCSYVLIQGAWSWRALVGAVLTGIISGLTTFSVSNDGGAVALVHGQHEAA